jgi:transglutaminase-like putative cysteine protease
VIGRRTQRGRGAPRPRIRPAAELAVAGLTVVTVLTSWRLFDGWDWVPVLVCAALLSHLVGALTRRAGWGALASLGTSLAGLVVFVGLVQFRSTTFLGLPTRATWEAAQLQLRAAWDIFPTAIAPVEAVGGFVTAMILLVWLLAYAADDFAHRAEAPIEAVVPSAVLFMVGTALGGDRHRLAAVALWLAAAVLTVAVLRVERSEGAGWFGGTRRRAVATTVRVGSVVAGVAVIVGVIAGPALPGASSDPLLDTRQGRSSRTTLSPLVDIQARLVNQSDVELFTVGSPQPSYWRMTALDEYDLRIWRSSRSYGDADGELGGGVPDALGAPLDHNVVITALDTVWLPAAFSPRRVSNPGQVRYDEESSSLLIRRSTLPEGLSYQVVSLVPVPTADALLAAVDVPVPAVIEERYLELPSDFPDRFRDLAGQITAAANTPYEQALALQNWFRTTFTYDVNVPPGHGETAIDAFISQRRGYCEQFAGTFAAFARSIGLPARVAVGFTPGDLGTDGRYHVRGRNAHAWPEVYLGGVGWLPFEPTPGRGEPGAESWTGVPPDQEGGPAGTPDGTATTTPTTGTVAPPAGPRTETGDEELLAVPAIGGGGSPSSGGVNGASTVSRVALILLALAVAGLIGLVVVAIVRERSWTRRWRDASTGPDRVLVTWQHLVDGLRRTGVPVPASDTPQEVADRVGPMLDGEDGDRQSGAGVSSDALEELARQATAAAYSGEPETTDADECEKLRTGVQHRAVARLPWRRRLTWRFMPA